MEERKIKIEKIFGVIFFTWFFTALLCGLWTKLEIHFYGTIKLDPVDDIVLIPMIFSFYFNSKQIIEKLYKKWSGGDL